LLEGKGVRTGLLVTEGFRGIYPVGEQARPYGTAIFDVMYDKPPALVPLRLTGEVKERVDFRGHVLRPLDESALRETVRELKAHDIESLAVCLLFSFLHPAHEMRVREIVLEEMPDCSVSLSSEVLPQIREYYRLSTTVINAYLQPILTRYIAQLDRRLSGAGIATRQKYIMQSNGGMATFTAASRRAVTTVLSGPAGGVTAGALACRTTGFHNIITFDMGGTSCDVALIKDGEPLISGRGKIEGRDLAVPMLDINTVSAGGGTIAAVDRFGVLRVGPASAGAAPGRSATGAGRGADHHRLHLALGYLGEDNFLGGTMRLDAAKARAAIEQDRAVARSRRGPSRRRDRAHYRREDGGGDQGHLHHARARPARFHAARLRRRRTGACEPHRPRSRNGRRDRTALSRRVLGDRPAHLGRQARLYPVEADAARHGRTGGRECDARGIVGPGDGDLTTTAFVRSHPRRAQSGYALCRPRLRDRRPLPRRSIASRRSGTAACRF
jgi:hypothetical protein